MRYRWTWIAASVVLAAAVAVVARAEKPLMSPAELRETATHVVVGRVKAIYRRESMEGKWRYQRYIAEVEVQEVEKGEGLAKAAFVYARYWTRSWTGTGDVADTNGHSGFPKEGQTLRIYLARNAHDGFDQNADGGFNVMGPNGFEAIPPK